MKTVIPLLVIVCVQIFADETRSTDFNRVPLIKKPYAALPLGSIKPSGWLEEQLQRMATGMTGHLDEWYPEVCGPRNAWLGGDGDTWERGPYWIDGLYPLSILLDNQELQQKAMQWIEWTLNNQQPNGQIGPRSIGERDRPPPEGAQVLKPNDWWPRMVMLKVLQQYYSATGDQRVIDCMTRYFRYQLRELPDRPLHDPDNKRSGSWWARQRGGDNLMSVYWLYNITGDPFLLELADLIHEQTIPVTGQFLSGKTIRLKRHEGTGDAGDNEYIHNGAYHCVNLAQMMKTPAIRYQADGNPLHLEALDKAFADIQRYHGQPHTLYGGDEGMHGRELTRGSEMCTAVEMMFSLEKIIEITGLTEYADRLEMIAYNVLPTQISDDFTTRQYFQQANQISATFGDRNFFNDWGDRVVFGLTSGYPCCTCNLHQAWPKFVQHLWMASNDGGVAALVYGPSILQTSIKGQLLRIEEITDYPMENIIRFRIQTESVLRFPLHLRIPAWCLNPLVTVNGQPVDFSHKDGIARLEKSWKNGDTVELELPTDIRIQRWHENSASIYWGPLLFALKMNENWSLREEPSPQGRPYQEVASNSPWNFALIENQLAGAARHFAIEQTGPVAPYFWNIEKAPLSITIDAVRHKNWVSNKQQAGTIPWSPQNPWHPKSEWISQLETIELIPYGCTTLRIAAFPTVRKPNKLN